MNQVLLSRVWSGIGGVGIAVGMVVGTAMARPGGGGSETPCWQNNPAGVVSCTFWNDLTDPEVCPDQFAGGGSVPDIQPGSPGQTSYMFGGTPADCHVLIMYWDEDVEACRGLSGYQTFSLAGRVPTGDPC